MEAGSSSLLRLLGGGVGPTSATGPAHPPDRASLDFGLMLERARAGRLHTGLPVRVPDSLAASLDDDARTRLSEAVDAASGEGISRALVLLGERTFRVDVAARSVIDAPGPQQTAVGGIDGLVWADARAQGTPAVFGRAPEAGIGPARLVRNASLIRALAGAPTARP